MDYISIGILVASGILGLIAYLLKTDREVTMRRLDALELSMTQRPTEQDVRTILDDKIEPLKESMTEVKIKVDKVIDLLIQK